MNAPHSPTQFGFTAVADAPLPLSSRIYYGWFIVPLAALAMLSTLPGRTHGLGLITEPLLADLKLDGTSLATINLWATLIGSAFCLPTGRWIDRFGSRPMLTLISLLLGLTVVAMSQAAGYWALFTFVLLSRGLGQSALSVAANTLVSKWFNRRIALAMSIYGVLTVFFFAFAFGGVGYLVREHGWRNAWLAVGVFLLAIMTPLAWLLVRNTPEECGLLIDGRPTPSADEAAKTADAETSYTLSQALRTPAFWVFALATSFFGLVSSGMGLYYEGILAERGFDQKTYHTLMAITTLIGLFGQMAIGFSIPRLGLRWSLSLALFVYAASLFLLPNISDMNGLTGYMIAMGISGGAITVLFFAAWTPLYGRAHVGRIQSAAQLATVFTSAVGPLLFAECKRITGSYFPILHSLALAVVLLAVLAAFVALPSRGRTPCGPRSADAT